MSGSFRLYRKRVIGGTFQINDLYVKAGQRRQSPEIPGFQRNHKKRLTGLFLIFNIVSEY